MLKTKERKKYYKKSELSYHKKMKKHTNKKIRRMTIEEIEEYPFISRGTLKKINRKNLN